MNIPRRLFYVLSINTVLALHRIKLGIVSNSASIVPSVSSRSQILEAQTSFYTTGASSAEEGILTENGQLNSPNINSGNSSRNDKSNKEEVRIVPVRPKRKRKKKKMKKVEVKPRGGRNIKDTYQNLKPWRTQLIEAQAMLTTTSPAVITLEPIYDRTSGTFYSQEELHNLCTETKSIARKFGIRDILTFASNNCSLIRLYYPNVTCQQINVFLQYCESIVS